MNDIERRFIRDQVHDTLHSIKFTTDPKKIGKAITLMKKLVGEEFCVVHEILIEAWHLTSSHFCEREGNVYHFITFDCLSERYSAGSRYANCFYKGKDGLLKYRKHLMHTCKQKPFKD